MASGWKSWVEIRPRNRTGGAAVVGDDGDVPFGGFQQVGELAEGGAGLMLMSLCRNPALFRLTRRPSRPVPDRLVLVDEVRPPTGPGPRPAR